MSKQKDPAILSYFFRKGYEDLFLVIKSSWKKNVKDAKDFRDRMKSFSFDLLNQPLDSVQHLLWGFSALSTIIFGTFFFLSFSFVHTTILVIMFSLFYITFSIFWIIEKIYLFIHSYFMACPHCHAHTAIPEYYCSNCNRIHKFLYPNKYGIFFHLCQCGKNIPSSFFTNRGKLQAHCPTCSQDLSREHIESKRLFIPIIGGPSSGKSSFLFNATKHFIENDASKLGFDARLFDRESESNYNKNINLLKNGEVPNKTDKSVPPAFNLSLHKNGKLEYLLYLYDPAGEAYQKIERLEEHSFNNYLSGIVLIIDPFSIALVQDKYKHDIAINSANLKPCYLPTSKVLERLLNNLESNFHIPKFKRIKQPLAVIINKTDAFDLKNIFSESALTNFMIKHKLSDRNESYNKLIKQQLIDWGEHGVINQIEQRFSTVRYFACSTLGRMPDNSQKEFNSPKVTEPLLWILSMKKIS